MTAIFWVLSLGGIATAIVTASAASQSPWALEVRLREARLSAESMAEAGLLAARTRLARGEPAALDAVPLGRGRVTVRAVERDGEPVLIAIGTVETAGLPGGPHTVTRELRVRLGPPGPDGLPALASWEAR